MQGSREKGIGTQEMENSMDMPTLDFMKSLNLTNLDESLREKINLLQSYGKAFETGYQNQKELNTKLKQIIGHKEKEYQNQEAEIKSLKARLNQMKTQNRSLEDSLAKALQEKEEFRAHCKKLQAKVEKLVKYAAELQKTIKVLKVGSNLNLDNRDAEESKGDTFMRLCSGISKADMPSENRFIDLDDGRKESNDRESEQHVHFAEQKSSGSDRKSREEVNEEKPEKLTLKLKKSLENLPQNTKSERVHFSPENAAERHVKSPKERHRSSERKETIFTDDEEEKLTPKNARFSSLSSSPSNRKSDKRKHRALSGNIYGLECQY